MDYLTAYLVISAGFAFFFIFLYSTLLPSERSRKVFTARCAMLSWAWPIGVIAFVVYGLIQILKGTPQFFKDAFGSNDGTYLNN